MKRDKLYYIVIVLGLMVSSCKTTAKPVAANNSFYIRNSNDYNSKEIYDSNNKLIYVLNRSDARIDWKTEIIQSYLLYLTSNDELVVVDLISNEKELIIPDIGDFAATNDLHYICLGKKLNDSRYTTTPILYDFTKKKIVEIEKLDYSFLNKYIGISTDIRFDPEKNGFSVDYHWDSSIPEYSFYISLEELNITRIK